MQVIKRNGNPQEISFDKITKRIRDLSYGLSKVDPLLIAKETINGIFDGIKTTELDLLSAEICATKTHHHPEYNKLGGRILVSNIIKTTFDDYVSVIQPLYENKIISEKFYNFVVENRDAIQEMFVYERDYLFDFFGMKTLERSYLFKINGKIMERPQHMWMRVAIQIHGFKENPIPFIKETYDLMSLLYFTHATPTLFNSGTNNPQLSSCFLLSTEDNIEDIFKSISDIAQISKWSGGIGLSLSTIRAKGSLIHGTNGKSEGIIPLCKTLEMVGRYINQGGKRQGSIACFCEDTEIFTINEGVKKIQDVKLGDLVVTHNNRVRPVIQFHKNPLGDRKIYKLKVERNKDVYVTGNHKFWSFHTKKYKDNKISVGWNSIEELKNIIDKKETTRTSCYISYPSNNGIETIKDKKIDVLDYKNIFNEFVKDFEIKDQKIIAISRSFDRHNNHKIAKSQSINRFWNITEDFANLIGIWLGDGHIKKYKGKIFGIGFTVYKHNTNEINYIIKNCKEIFGCNVTHYASKTNNCINILVNSHMIASIFMELFGSDFAGKKLANMCFGWSKKMIYSLLAGLITTDGHITKKCNITLSLSNQKLMNELYHLCRNTGIDVSILKNKIQKGQTCDSYTMSIPLIKEILDNTYKYYTDDRYQKCYEHLEKDKKVDTFLKIISITETDRKDDFVYTLGIEEDHSYTVEGLLAQNCYLEPWHADIYSFIELRKNTGDENLRARDLFIALWIPDLFMKRIQEDGEWTLMCPNECKGLADCYGEKFETLYISYEQEKKGKKVVKARDLWNHILENQIETGMPYISFKDSVNHKNMQKQLGTIRNSNLCVAPETMILTSTGYFPIKTLENQEIEIWNGEEFSKTVVYKTGENQKLITVKFSNGHTLDCTPYHKFYIKDKIVEAKDLQKDMEIIDFSYPVIKTGFDVIIHHQNSPIYVPINGSLHVKLVWLYEIFEMYGKIMDNKYYLELSTDILERTSFLIQTLGCNTVIQENVLICSNSTMKKLLLLGLKTNFVVDVDDIKDKIYISEIVYKNRHSDTFCFKEQKRGMGIFNGILTGQCNEIALFSNKDNIAVCFTGDTQILTENGYKCIKDCDNENVLSYFDDDMNMNPKEKFIRAKLIDNGEKDIFELKCTGTKPIKVTSNHLFAVYNGTIRNKKGIVKRNYQWKKADELSLDDKILLPKTSVLPKYDINFQVNEDYLTIGWMLGDGWQHKSKKTNKEVYGVCFGSTDIYARDRVIKKINDWMDQCNFHKYGFHKKNTEYYTDKRTGVFSWASSKQQFIQNIKDNFGLECKNAHYKIIPEKIKKSSPTEQSSFLSGLFSADGSVYILDKKFYINLSSASETLLYDVKNMLKCFGIESRVVYSSVKNNTNTQGKLTIETIDSIKNYYKYINFTLSLAKSEKLKHGLDTIKKISKYSEFCKLKSLTYIGKEKVYDLNVPVSHNFIAEGFVVHNCNLSSICLPRFVKNKTFDFENLEYIAGVACRNLNNVIDVNFYPVPETKKTNDENRPIGIGIQGLSDVYLMLGLSFGSDEARSLNKRIFETIYFGSVKMSIELAKIDGPYKSIENSPHSEGLLQFDLWPNVETFYDWSEVKKDLKQYGIRNSLLTALMPTASTSQIMANNEAFEPYTSNIYVRKTLAGEFTVVNQHLINDLSELGLWNDNVYNEMLYDNGSVQNIKEIPKDIKDRYKTAYELKITDLLKQAVDRSPFIDHMQSMNLFMPKPDFNLLNSSHFYSWKNGLKTGMYYLRTQPAVDAIKFGLDPTFVKNIKEERKMILKNAGVEDGVCPRDQYLRSICESCSS